MRRGYTSTVAVRRSVPLRQARPCRAQLRLYAARDYGGIPVPAPLNLPDRLDPQDRVMSSWQACPGRSTPIESHPSPRLESSGPVQ